MEFGDAVKKYESEMIAFIQELVRTESFSCREEAAARKVEKRMNELGFDEVGIDSVGNVLGRIGSGKTALLFDSHMDTVEVHDAVDWRVPPFSGEIVEGRLYGRGSVDMKSALGCSIYAAVAARECGWTEGKTVYVSGTVDEEYCDGVSLRLMLEESGIRPDYVMICEPSDNVVMLGHKGKAQLTVTTHGVSAHGSAPEKGVNAVYEMAEVIKRVEKNNLELSDAGGHHGTMVLSDISSVSASLNAVPSECRIYLDRRMVLGETEETIKAEMEKIVGGKNADWDYGILRNTCWTGREIEYKPLHMAWRIAEDHPLTQACAAAFAKTTGQAPREYGFWDFGTNAVATVDMGIPTIGYGPGDPKLAHMVNENCSVDRALEALRFYAHLINEI